MIISRLYNKETKRAMLEVRHGQNVNVDREGRVEAAPKLRPPTNLRFSPRIYLRINPRNRLRLRLRLRLNPRDVVVADEESQRQRSLEVLVG